MFVSISSGAGLVAFGFASAYAASKFGLEGWKGALAQEVAPFGIHTTIINPGFFRTERMEPESTTWPTPYIDDHAEGNAAQRIWWESQNGVQPGDPAKLAQALLFLANQAPPPARFLAGADAVALAQQRIAELAGELDAHRDRSMALEFTPGSADGGTR